MTDADFAGIDLIGLEGLISDENIDLDTLSYSKDEQLVSFDVMRVKRDHPRTERNKKRILTVYPIVRQTIRFHNVTHLKTRFGKREVELHGVTLYCGKEGSIEIGGGGGKLVITVSRLETEVGPEIETEYEYVMRKLWWRITYGKWRLKQRPTEFKG